MDVLADIRFQLLPLIMREFQIEGRHPATFALKSEIDTELTVWPNETLYISKH
jgi:hypothetical protein